MAASKRSALSVDIDGKRSTKGAGKETRSAESENSQLKSQLEKERKAKDEALSRSPNPDVFIITTRVKKGLKRLKFLQTEITKKQRTVENGGRSKRLEPYKKERDALVQQMREDISELQSIFDDEYSKTFERKDKRRTTTGGMGKENRETLGLRSAESEINQLKSQLEKERKAKDEALSRSAESEINQLKSQLEKERKAKDEALSSLRNAKSEINQLTSQLENERKSKEEALSLRSAESEINQLTSQLEKGSVCKEEALSRLEAKNNQLINQLENERKAKEDALVSLRSAESDINQLKSQLENERKSNEEVLLRLNRRLDESENEKVALNLSHQEEIRVHKEDKRKLQERLTIDKSYEERAKELKGKCDELGTELARSEKKLKEVEHENKTGKCRLEDENRRIVENLKRLEDENRRIVENLKRLEAKTNQLTNQLENERKAKEDALLRLEAKNNLLNNQLENERKAKEDALLRLSSMASNKLRDNNPNIADLSDPNRPTKLSEQFSELYDNEWTDAFDELEKLLGDKQDKEIISYLRDFVLEIHSVCSDLSFSKMKTIEEAFVKPSVPSENTKIPTEILKTIKDGIKSIAPKLLEDARDLVLRRLEERYLQDAVAGCLQHHNIKRYIDKCTEVCWYMSVQDPQLVMDGSKSSDEKFDSNKHREYTKKGPYEEFVVWPVLYLYKGGQMLSKGVAQGTKKEAIGQQ